MEKQFFFSVCNIHPLRTDKIQFPMDNSYMYTQCKDMWQGPLWSIWICLMYFNFQLIFNGCSPLKCSAIIHTNFDYGVPRGPCCQFGVTFCWVLAKRFLRDIHTQCWCGHVGVLDDLILLCYCFLSGFKCFFSCIVKYSLYHNMDAGTMWHCTLVSSTPSQSIEMFFLCVCCSGVECHYVLLLIFPWYNSISSYLWLSLRFLWPLITFWTTP